MKQMSSRKINCGNMEENFYLVNSAIIAFGKYGGGTDKD